MKKVAGTLKLDQAQFRELEAFAKFGSDLDAATLAVLEKGRRNVEILKQAQYSPVPVSKQVAIIYLGTKGLLRDVPLEKIREFEELYLNTLDKQYPDILENLRKGQMTDDMTSVMEQIASDLSRQYKKQ
jgi:F-type H+-transporting ATPase subunit alpha